MARRTREQWLGLFQAQVESGLSAKHFCRRRSINPNYFCQRKKVLGWVHDARNEETAGFVQLKPPMAGACAIELSFGSVSLSLPASASPGWVAALMRELASASV